MIGKNTFLFIVSLGLWFLSHAQDPFAQRMTITNGLPSNAVYSILEDHKGYIWFTCDEGLFRYDGKTYLPFKAEKQAAYSGSGIMEDALGRIWYQTFDGDSYYVENNQLKWFAKRDKVNYFPTCNTQKHLFDKSTNHLDVYDLKSTKLLKSFKIKSEMTFTWAVFKGDYYFIENETLYRITTDLNRQKVIDLPINPSDFLMLFASDDNLFFVKKTSSDNGIWEVNNGSIRKIATFPPNQLVQSAKCSKGLIFIQTTQGSLVYNSSGKQIAYFFSNLNLSDVLIDRKNNYWFTSTNEGIALVPRVDVKQTNLSAFAPLRLLRINNQLIISTKNEQLLAYNPTTKRTTTIYEGRNNAEIYYLFHNKIRDELLYVKSDGYTYSSALNSFSKESKGPLAIKQIVALDQKYNAFVASGTIGFMIHKSQLNQVSDLDKWVQKLESKTIGDFLLFELKNNIRGKSVVYDAKKKAIFYATNVGLFVFKNGTFKEVKSAQKAVFMSSLFVWNNQVMGFGSNGKVVQISENGCNQQIIHPAITGTSIKQVLSYHNILLVRTVNTLFVFKKVKGRTIKFASFDLTNQECNDMLLMDQTVWMVTNNGLIEWDLQHAIKKTIHGLFQVDEFIVNNNVYPATESATFTYDQNNVTINFSLLDFGSKTIENVWFRVNNQGWRKIDPNIRQINFSSLSPDDYRIEFKGKVNGSIRLLQTLRFSIAPPFWKTAWFLSLLAIAIFGLSAFYYRRQLRIVRLRNQLINEKIVLESDLNKSLLASIKSQMNPHFIFNALNTIQAYIFMNDKENATGYLSKFSKLTRSVLEMSEQDEVVLSEEIDTLILYLDLEKMRFQEGFNYSLDTTNVEIDTIKIPSMLIQPYVENAIKHGLLHSSIEKELKITFCIKENCLLVEIDDNGIGRKRAEELRLQRDKFHAGFSTKANEKRLKLLGYENSVVVSFTDKYDAHQQATGTTVKLTIQLKRK